MIYIEKMLSLQKKAEEQKAQLGQAIAEKSEKVLQILHSFDRRQFHLRMSTNEYILSISSQNSLEIRRKTKEGLDYTSLEECNEVLNYLLKEV